MKANLKKYYRVLHLVILNILEMKHRKYFYLVKWWLVLCISPHKITHNSRHNDHSYDCYWI